MAKKSINPELLEYGDHPASWVINGKELDDQEIRRIFEYYVWYGPFSGVSAREKTFKDLGWKDNNPKKDGYMIKRLLSVAELIENVNLFVANDLGSTKQLFVNSKMNSDFWEEYKENRIAIMINQNYLVAIFKAIRNSFAHGRFRVIDNDGYRCIAFENGESKKDRFITKARMILKVSTLQQWQTIIQTEAEKELRVEQERIKNIEKALINLINRKSIKSEEVLYDLLEFDKNEVRSVFKTMKNRSVEYNRHERKWKVI